MKTADRKGHPVSHRKKKNAHILTLTGNLVNLAIMFFGVRKESGEATHIRENMQSGERTQVELIRGSLLLFNTN